MRKRSRYSAFLSTHFHQVISQSNIQMVKLQKVRKKSLKIFLREWKREVTVRFEFIEPLETKRLGKIFFQKAHFYLVNSRRQDVQRNKLSPPP